MSGLPNGPNSVFAPPALTGERAARRILNEVVRSINEFRLDYDAAVRSDSTSHKRQSNLSRLNLEQAVNALRTVTSVDDPTTAKITESIARANEIMGNCDPFEIVEPVRVPVTNVSRASPRSMSRIAPSAFRPIPTSRAPSAPLVTDGAQAPTPAFLASLRQASTNQSNPTPPTLPSRIEPGGGNQSQPTPPTPPSRTEPGGGGSQGQVAYPAAAADGVTHPDGRTGTGHAGRASAPPDGRVSRCSSRASQASARESIIAESVTLEERLKQRHEMERKRDELLQKRDELLREAEKMSLAIETRKRIERTQVDETDGEIERISNRAEEVDRWVAQTIPRHPASTIALPHIPATNAHTQAQAHIGRPPPTQPAYLPTQIHAHPIVQPIPNNQTQCVTTQTYTRPLLAPNSYATAFTPVAPTYTPTYQAGCAPTNTIQMPQAAPPTQIRADAMPFIPQAATLQTPFITTPSTPPNPTVPAGTSNFGSTHSGQAGLLEGDINRSLLTVNLRQHSRSLMVQSRPTKENRFTGDNVYQDYESFENNFDTATDHEGITDQMRYLELKQWVAGPAEVIVLQYQNEKDFSVALQKAKNHLKREFAGKISTARQMLDELLSGPKLQEKDVKTIQMFILRLGQVHQRAVETEREATFSTRETYNEILRRKLPPYFGTKWAARQTDHEERCATDSNLQKNLSFQTFIDFCRRINRISVNKQDIYKTETPAPNKPAANENAGGAKKKQTPAINSTGVEVKVAASTSSKPHKKPPPKRDPPKKSFADAATPKPGGNDPPKSKPPAPPPKTAAGDKPCPACQTGTHDLSSCREFLKKSIDDKKELVLKHGRCFLCLQYGHMVNTCPSEITCDKCGKNHNTLFHRPRPEKVPETQA